MHALLKADQLQKINSIMNSNARSQLQILQIELILILDLIMSKLYIHKFINNGRWILDDMLFELDAPVIILIVVHVWKLAFELLSDVSLDDLGLVQQNPAASCLVPTQIQVHYHILRDALLFAAVCRQCSHQVLAYELFDHAELLTHQQPFVELFGFFGWKGLGLEFFGEAVCFAGSEGSEKGESEAWISEVQLRSASVVEKRVVGLDACKLLLKRHISTLQHLVLSDDFFEDRSEIVEGLLKVVVGLVEIFDIAVIIINEDIREMIKLVQKILLWSVQIVLHESSVLTKQLVVGYCYFLRLFLQAPDGALFFKAVVQIISMVALKYVDWQCILVDRIFNCITILFGYDQQQPLIFLSI